MSKILNKKEISDLLHDFSQLAGITVSFFDTSFQKIAESECGNCAFCRLVRSFDKGYEHCMKSDREHLALSAIKGESVTYTCHAGLCETVMPVYRDRELIGFLLFGRYRDADGKYSAIELVYDFCNSMKFDGKDALADEYYRLPVYTEQKISSSVNILCMCIKNVWTKDSVHLGKNRLIENITSYIDSHITEKIPVKELCERFFISQKTVYSLFRKYYQCTVLEYIERQRIDMAKELLSNPAVSIADIAKLCGYADYNYFIRVFGKVAGISPHAFRKLCYGKGNSTSDC